MVEGLIILVLLALIMLMIGDRLWSELIEFEEITGGSTDHSKSVMRRIKSTSELYSTVKVSTLLT